MKKILSCLLAMCIMLGTFGFVYANESTPITIMVGGKVVEFPDGKPYQTGDRVMVPVRFVSESLGAKVNWFEQSKTVTVMDEKNAIELSVGSSEVTANNETITLDVPPVYKDDRNYVPLRFVSEALGCTVDWDESTKTVKIAKNAVSEKTENDKKIYALYHGFRRSREHDGDLGTWSQYYTSEKSATGKKYINYSADLIDENGINNVASINKGPIVGLQSEIDPDYIEYKMLLAKIANIDGFMVDFGFPEYGNTVLMKAFMEQAQKYDMEVGADWCDGWLVDYDWIKGYRPEIKTREDKLNYFKTSLQFLIDEVYNTPSGAMIDNHPVVFLFGGGPTPAEMKDIINSKYTYPELMKTPYFIRRTGLTGKYQNGNVSFSDPSATTKDWRNAGVDVHQWIVPRIRPMDEKYPYFDKYASFDDVKNYAQDYKKLWDKGEKVNVNTAVVTPGFDNRGCAAWGDGTYHGFDREGGEVYKWQWDFYNKNKEQIDVMFIASWSDFTEGHEIEPTVVNGYRELETTLEYSTQFKDAEYDENAKEGMKVPQKLFETKKYTRKIGEIGFDVKDGLGMLDEAALGVSKGAYKFAESMISKTETINKEYEKNIEMQTITLSSENGNMKVVSYPKAEHQGSGIDGVEVAQGKPVSTNDDLSEGRAKNAVDGIIANSSRWITSQSKESYWLEIDLQNEYTLVGAELYTGKDEKTYGLKNVRLQYYKDSEWVDIPGAAVKDNPESNTDLFWKFDKSVVASKVRVVCDEGAVGVRVREVKIYGDPDLTEEKPNKPPVVKGKNIAKGKNVKTNNELSEGPIGNINDGIIADSSRWMTAQTLDSYWAEIDFGSEQKIVACDAYTGKDDGSWALETARLEYLVGENWATIPGAMVTGNSKTNTNLSWTFTEPVTTSKVRFVSDDGARGVRVREVMVYAEGVAESGNAENDTAFLESRGKEIAQGKTVKASTALKNNGAEKAVDGLVSDLSSWLTATNEDKYWLEVDLGGEYEIMGTDILSGKGDGTWAMQNVKLQAWQGDKWVDISGGGVKNNPKSKTDIKLNFNDTVKTDKVRLVCDDKDRGVRLRELKIYEAKAEASTSTTKVHNLGQGAYITVDEDTAKILRDNYFDAMLNLEYLGDTNQTFTITADCDRPLPEKIGTTQGNFATVAEIREDITHGWEKCRVKMFKDNLDLNHGLEKDSDFIIKGTGNVRNIEMTFKVYKKVRSDDTTHEK